MTRTPDRIVILNDFSSPRGGAEYLALTLAARLAGSGQPVTFLSGDAGDSDAPSGVDLVALGGRALLEEGARSGLVRGLYNRSTAAGIAQWIARNDTPGTVYHLHNWSLILSPSVFDALAPLARRCVIHAHDFFLACPNGAYFDYPRRSVCTRDPLSASCLATQCDKRSYSHKLWRAARHGVLFRKLGPFLASAQFVMTYEPMRAWLTRAIAPRRLTAVNNPVEAFGPIPLAPERQSRLVYVGQIQALKGVFDIAEAGRRIGAVIDFFGEGDARAELMARYPEHASHGWTRRDAIGAEMAGARAVIVATQSLETFCLSAFEALATGLPLVVSNSILAAPSLVASGAALSYTGADVQALTDLLGRIVADDHLVADLAAAARRQGPTLSQSVDQWVAALREIYAERLAEA